MHLFVMFRYMDKPVPKRPFPLPNRHSLDKLYCLLFNTRDFYLPHQIMLLDTSKQKKIEGLLLNGWNDARERMRSPLIGQEVPSYTFTLKDGSLGFIVGIKGMTSMNEIMELILS